MIKSQDLKKYGLPDSPGVYLFKNKGNILYVGKATSLKNRVKSYFSSDLINTRGPLLADMIFKADKVDHIKTSSVLEALILEANLIKKHQPWFNTKEKDNKSFNYVVITKEAFPRILIERGRNLDKFSLPIKYSFGPFTNSTQLKEALKIIRKIFPYRDRCVPNQGKPCFNRQIGLCPGVCDGSVNKQEYRKIIKQIVLFLSGKMSFLKKTLKREMIAFSKTHNFEKAGEIRDQLFALDHIQDVALIKDDGLAQEKTQAGQLYRIEAYDAAHLSGTNNVGVMVVMDNGEFKKSDYRKFKINNSKGNDLGALEEILTRRKKHLEWSNPNLIVVDGGMNQYNIAKKIFTNISVMAVTKDDKHKAKGIIGDEAEISKYKKEILAINSEAHRFAIKYHRQKRDKIS